MRAGREGPGRRRRWTLRHCRGLALAGDHGWTRLQIEFGPMDGGMSIKLCAEGTGTA
jgi:hypothetical protein